MLLSSSSLGQSQDNTSSLAATVRIWDYKRCKKTTHFLIKADPRASKDLDYAGWRFGAISCCHFSPLKKGLQLLQLFRRMLQRCCAVKLQKYFVNCKTCFDFPSAWGWEHNDFSFGGELFLQYYSNAIRCLVTDIIPRKCALKSKSWNFKCKKTAVAIRTEHTRGLICLPQVRKCSKGKWDAYVHVFLDVCPDEKPHGEETLTIWILQLLIMRFLSPILRAGIYL